MKALPDWLFTAYSKLWVKNKENWFNFDSALKLLKIKNPKLLSKMFFDMRKFGWLEVKKDSKNPLKRLYKVKSPDTMVRAFAK